MIDAALAERADELMDAVCDGLIPTRGELQLEVRKLLAVCANEALEKAAVAGNQAMLDWNCTLRSDLREWAGRFVAERIRALKAGG